MITKTKKYKTLRRVMAFVLAIVLAIPNMSYGQVEADNNTYVLDATADLTAFTAGTYADGNTIAAGTGNYFTIYTSSKMKVDTSAKEFGDGYTAGQRINFGGKSDASVPKNVVAFTTAGAATVTLHWVSGGDAREMYLLNASGTTVASTSVGSVKNSLYISELSVPGAGTYYIAVMDGSNYLFKATVTESAAATPTAAPTLAPTAEPTLAPTAAPTAEPTLAPTSAPTQAPAGEVQATRTVTYSFRSNSGLNKPVMGEILDGTNTTTSGILYVYGTGSGCTFDPNQLRFRNGTELWIPIQDDTTKITYAYTGNGNNAGRPTYVLSTDSGYELPYDKTERSVTIDDITDYIKTVGDQKYFAIYSGGDIKILEIKVTEYNPINAVTVSGTVEGAAAAGVDAIVFKNMDDADAAQITADVDAQGNYTAVLKRVAGNTNYAAVVKKVGYKIDDTNGADRFTLVGNDATATQNFKIATSPVSQVSGTVSGITAADVKGTLGIELVPDNAALGNIALTLSDNGDGTYSYASVSVDVNRNYTVKLTNADDYEVTDAFVVATEGTATKNIVAAKKATYEVSGQFVTNNDGTSDVTAITFTNKDNTAYSYTFNVTGGSYTAKLRAAEYVTSVTSASYTAYDHVSVKNAAVSNDVYLEGAVDTSAVAYKETVTVGASGKDFTTISDALAYIARMTRTSSQRVTIELTAGETYREQLVVDVPNVTIKGNGATITWYYGVGFSYYSAKLSADGKEAYYDEARAVDKYEQVTISQNPGHWGATVNLRAGATGFAAENVVFENSLNRYITTEEIVDGAAANVAVAVTDRTTANIDVRTKAAKERAAALYNQADNVEFKDCKFLSSQDTLYTGDSTENSYFVNCFIEGTTDYICGDGNPVFDSCTLSMYSYSDMEATGSYLAASKGSGAHGYLFSDCKIVSTTDAGLKSTSSNILCRAWGPGTVHFMNTEVESETMIDAVAYKDMNSKVTDAHYYEYNTHLSNGTQVDTSRRATGVTIMDDAAAAAIVMTDWFDAWQPMYYKGTVPQPTPAPTAAPTATPVPGGSTQEVTYVLDTTTDLAAATAGTYTDGQTVQAGTDNYFTLIMSAKAKVDPSNKTFDDAYASSQRLNFGGKTDLTVPKNAIEFTISNPATVKVWFVEGGDDNRQIAILNASGEQVAISDGTYTKNSPYIESFTLTEAGKYYVANPTNNNNFCKVEVTETVTVAPADKEYVLDTTTDLAAATAGTYTDGQTVQAGTGNFFTLIMSAKTKVDASSKIFDDAYESSQRLNFGGKTDLTVPKNGIQITTDNSATVKVWFVQGGDDNRQVAILDSTGATVATTAGTYTKNSPYIETLEIPEAGTYYIANPTNNNNFCKIVVTVAGAGGSAKPERADWSGVAAPVIESVAAGSEAGTVDVTVTANIGYDGADEVYITMYDAQGNEIASRRSIAEKTSHTLSFSPDASGTYTFQAKITREGEADKLGAEDKNFDFVLPLGTPALSGATCLGGGKVSLKWTAVQEADSYIISAKGTNISKTVNGLTGTLEGLTIGESYTFTVAAVRGQEVSAEGTLEWKVVDGIQREWNFAAFGQSIDTKNNTASGSVYDNNLVVKSLGNKGKLVPASTDGLAFYYTTIDPDTENFTLSADITVNKWTYTNGQEGFGMMVADAVGTHGSNSVFWNNSYMLTATKVEYYWNNGVADSGSKYSMRLGIGAQEKKGVTADNIPTLQGGDLTAFSQSMYPLSTCAVDTGMGAGSYNMVGNYTNANLGNIVDVASLQTTFHMEIQRNNTGYFLTYTDEAGNVTTQKFYHGDNGDELTMIDADNIYVGFFAARTCDISVTNVELTTINPADDAPAESRPVTYVTPNYSIESAKISNSSDYELVFYGNADGKLTVEGPNGVIVDGKDVSAETKERIQVSLDAGKTDFKITFVPDPEYKPDKYVEMENYDTVSFYFPVEYKVNVGEIIYVSPTGSSKADGTKENPMDIYTAVTYAAPGQKIYLMEGTYNLTRTVTVERGINGTADQMIYLVADPEATSRPVLDFGGVCAGMVLAGDYWYFQGFDVTKSAPSQKGIQISGDHNTMDNIHAYRNGNTGIQISRYKSSDLYEDWPSYNLVLNCTSYLNADPGYEDADGFAAKLTIADGNVFDGCISAYNADDGWDLFAKIESGPIGKVVIKNSIAFKNGYDLDENGNEIDAGNGNGFKMGGASISGYHELINSYAFANKAKGIDSNSCPDIQVKDSVSFNNGSYNVALYTNDASNTDFSATGIISYKDANAGNTTGENFKFKGSQDQNKVYGETNYYYPGGNSLGVAATDAWFVSLDTDAAIHGGITRNADGTINMGGYLELTSEAPSNTNVGMGGTASGTVDSRSALEILEDINASLDADNSLTNANNAIVTIKNIPASAWNGATAGSELISRLAEAASKIAAITGQSVTIVNNASALTVNDILNAVVSLPAGENGTLTVEEAAIPTRLPQALNGATISNASASVLALTNAAGTAVDLTAPVVVEFNAPANLDACKAIYVLQYTPEGGILVHDGEIKDGKISVVTDELGTFVIVNYVTEEDNTAAEGSASAGAGSSESTGSASASKPAAGKDDKKSPATSDNSSAADEKAPSVVVPGVDNSTPVEDTPVSDGVVATISGGASMLPIACAAAVVVASVSFMALLLKKREEEE